MGRNADADSLDLNVHDLAFPATTDPERLARQVNDAPADKMTVVFSTYHSIDVLTRAQKLHDLPEFDLVICDEAQRTIGVTLKDEDDSSFVRIHSNDYVTAKKRLYTPGTPRIFGEGAKRKADDHDAELASMDDETKFGKDMFHRGFGWAIENALLTDYKVVVLAVDEGLVSTTIQNRLKEGAELTLDDASKIIGCYKALTKSDLAADLQFDPHPMRRALAFCQTIAESKIIEDEFAQVVEEYLGNDLIDDPRNLTTEIAGVRIIGATLWTDLRLYPEFDELARIMVSACMQDYRAIRTAPDTCFTTDDMLDRHAQNKAAILAALRTPHDGRIVVMHHHLPLRELIAPWRTIGGQAKRAMNNGFACDLWDEIKRFDIDTWIWGHSHEGRSRTVEGDHGPIRFVTNQRGYPGEKVEFDPAFVLEV